MAIANGKATPTASREAGITEQTCYRSRKEYGGLKVDQAKRLKELEQENGKLKCLAGKSAWISRSFRTSPGETSKPGAAPYRCGCAQQRGASERHACQLVHQPRGAQRYHPTQRDNENALTRAIISLASQYGRYGYRRITIKVRRQRSRGTPPLHERRPVRRGSASGAAKD